VREVGEMAGVQQQVPELLAGHWPVILIHPSACRKESGRMDERKPRDCLGSASV